MSSTCKIVLASSSPRRRQLFSFLGLDFSVIQPGDCKELNEAHSHIAVKKMVVANAYSKARSVSVGDDVLVISADTVVFCKGRLFAKPKSKDEAREFLYILSRTPHYVYTGVVMIRSEAVLSAVDRTKIYMDPLSWEEIDYYLSKEEVLDKAGGFGIQGFAGSFIRRIEGCFYNVMGLPLALVRSMLKEMGIELVRFDK